MDALEKRAIVSAFILKTVNRMNLSKPQKTELILIAINKARNNSRANYQKWIEPVLDAIAKQFKNS